MAGAHTWKKNCKQVIKIILLSKKFFFSPLSHIIIFRQLYCSPNFFWWFQNVAVTSRTQVVFRVTEAPDNFGNTPFIWVTGSLWRQLKPDHEGVRWTRPALLFFRLKLFLQNFIFVNCNEVKAFVLFKPFSPPKLLKKYGPSVDKAYQIVKNFPKNAYFRPHCINFTRTKTPIREQYLQHIIFFVTHEHARAFVSSKSFQPSVM